MEGQPSTSEVHNGPTGAEGAAQSVRNDHSMRITKPRMSASNDDNVLANTNQQLLDSHFYQLSNGLETSPLALVEDPMGYMLPYVPGLSLSHHDLPSIQDIPSAAAVLPRQGGMRTADHITHPQVAPGDRMDTTAPDDNMDTSSPSNSGATSSNVCAPTSSTSSIATGARRRRNDLRPSNMELTSYVWDAMCLGGARLGRSVLLLPDGTVHTVDIPGFGSRLHARTRSYHVIMCITFDYRSKPRDHIFSSGLGAVSGSIVMIH